MLQLRINLTANTQGTQICLSEHSDREKLHCVNLFPLQGPSLPHSTLSHQLPCGHCISNCWVKSLLLCFLASSLLMCQGSRGRPPSTWVPANHVGYFDIASISRFWTGPEVATVANWGVIRQMEDGSLSLSLMLLLCFPTLASPPPPTFLSL